MNGSALNVAIFFGCVMWQLSMYHKIRPAFKWHIMLIFHIWSKVLWNKGGSCRINGWFSGATFSWYLFVSESLFDFQTLPQLYKKMKILRRRPISGSDNLTLRNKLLWKQCCEDQHCRVKPFSQQECIPVECVPPACWPYLGGGWCAQGGVCQGGLPKGKGVADTPTVDRQTPVKT